MERCRQDTEKRIYFDPTLLYSAQGFEFDVVSVDIFLTGISTALWDTIQYGFFLGM